MLLATVNIIYISYTLQELVPRKATEVDEFRLESVGNAVTIPSNSLALPPIVKRNKAQFISSGAGSKSATKHTIHSFDLQSGQWNSTDIATTCSPNQAAFPLLYNDDTAIIRVTSTETQSAKVGIHKLTEMSHWEVIPFTSETVKPVELNNCQYSQSKRYIVLVSVVQSTIAFHVHNCKDSSHPWSSITFSLPTTKTSYVLQSCAIAHHTVFCSLMSTERNRQQKITVYKLKLEYAMEKGKPQNNPDLELVYSYDSNVLQCHLFVASGEIMMMNIITTSGDRKSSTLELCTLNDTLVNFKRQKKDYPFVMKLLSVVPSTTYNNQALVVYYDNRSSKTHLEMFCLPSLASISY